MGIRFYVAVLALAGTVFLVDRSEELFVVPFTRIAVQVSPDASAVDRERGRPERREPAARPPDRRPVLAETVPALSAGEDDNADLAGQGDRPLRRPCWTPAELSGSPREEKSIKGVSARRVPPREQALPPALKLDEAMHGVIRRVQIPGAAKLVALTFNLNEHADEIGGYDGRLIDYLRQQQVRATFFVGGKWMTTHNLRARQLMADPLFEIGNNSWIRRDLRKEEPEPLTDEVEDAERAYQKLRRDYYEMACVASLEKGTGPAPALRMHLFRFPDDVCNARALAAINDAGLTVIQWDVNVGSPARLQSGPGGLALAKLRVRPGSIVQFHADGSAPQTAEALQVLIPWLRSEGYRFVTVSELLRQPGAQLEKTADCSYRAGSEKPSRSRRRDSWGDGD
jgi:peptidoglycan/xylan/chitin deacetylase (PgdA/CDA1 family)